MCRTRLQTLIVELFDTAFRLRPGPRITYTLGPMKHFAFLTATFVAFASHAFDLQFRPSADSFALRSMAARWEDLKVYEICYAQSKTYSVVKSASESWKSVLEKAARAASSSVQKVEGLQTLTTTSEIMSAGEILHAYVDEGQGSDLPLRLFDAADELGARSVYSATVSGAEGGLPISGGFVALVDESTNELVLLGYGDAYQPLRRQLSLVSLANEPGEQAHS